MIHLRGTTVPDQRLYLTLTLAMFATSLPAVSAAEEVHDSTPSRDPQALFVQGVAPGQSKTVVLELDEAQRKRMGKALGLEGRESEIARIEFTVFNNPEVQWSGELSPQSCCASGRATAGGKITAVNSSGQQLAAYQALWTWDYIERQTATIVGRDQDWWGPS